CHQRQKRQRPRRGKALPGRIPVALSGAYRTDNRLLVIIPLAGWQAGPLPKARLPAISRRHKICSQYTAIIPPDTPLAVILPPAGDFYAINQLYIAVHQCPEQCADNMAVFNNGSESRRLQFSRLKMNSPRAVTIPDNHILIGAVSTADNGPPG